MRITRSIASIALLTSCLAAPAFASSITYTASLSGAAQVPPNSSPATGSALYTLNGNLLTVDLSFSGLTAPALEAHVHCCAPPGANAPIVLPFVGFPMTSSGTYSNTFDLSTVALMGGATEASFLAGLNSGLAYTNIHDVNFPAGEIRGQILPMASAATPEPGTLLLLATGMVGAAGVVRRRLVR